MSARQLEQRITELQSRIHAACERAGRRPEDVTLVAVTKTHPVEIVYAAHSLGLLDLGESYVQEWRRKEEATTGLQPRIRWHFIGHLQSNKARFLVGRVHLVHSVDRLSVVDALGERSAAAGARTPILLEVNVAGEAQKSGCAPEAAEQLALAACSHPGLELRGLMTVAPDVSDPEEVRPVFASLRALRGRVREALPPAVAARFTELSMGMTSDLEVAIEEGATLVRVGTALFGAREP